MPIKIAFPVQKYFQPLIANISSMKSEVEIIFADEETASKMLFDGEVELALLNPLTYGRLVVADDYSVLPSTCISGINYTNLEKIYFANDLKVIQSFGISQGVKFLEIIAKLVLLEKYDFDVNVINYSMKDDPELFKYDGFLSEENLSTWSSLDLTEEWYDYFEFELPLGFWVMNKNNDSDNLLKITRKLAANNNKNKEVHEEVGNEQLGYQREGLIKYQFDSDTEKAIDEILELFYEMRIIDEMTDTKIVSN